MPVFKKIVIFTLWCGHLIGQDLNTRLFEAIERKYFWQVQRLLDRGASVYARQEQTGITPLIAAVKSGNLQIISRLLRSGASIAQTDGSGKNVLHHVVLLRAFNIASGFMKPSIIDAQDTAGCTPLHVAVRRGYSFFVNLLLRNHADTNIVDRRGKKPIDYALANNNTAIVSLLLKHHAHIAPEVATQFLKTAVKNDCVRLIQQLVERGANINYINDAGQCILHHAGNASPETIVQLMSYAPPLEAASDFGLRPLHIAVGASNIDFIHALLEAGAEVNCRALDHSTPLMLARDEAIVDMLLSHGADINAVDDNGQSLLMLADGQLLDCLLKRKPSLEVKDHEGLTALMHAARRHECMKLRSLIAAGARVDAVVASSNKTALHFVDPHRSDVARVLIESGANPRALDRALNIAGMPFQATADLVIDQALLNLDMMQVHQVGRPCIVEAGVVRDASCHQDQPMCSSWFDATSYQGLLTSFHHQHLYEAGAAFANPHTRMPLHRMPYLIDNVHNHLLSIFGCERLSVDCMYDRFVQDSITLEPFLVRHDEARSLVKDWLKSGNKYTKASVSRIMDEARTPHDCYSMPKLLEEAKAELSK